MSRRLQKEEGQEAAVESTAAQCGSCVTHTNEALATFPKTLFLLRNQVHGPEQVANRSKITPILRVSKTRDLQRSCRIFKYMD